VTYYSMVSALSGFHPWRRFDNVLAWTVLRTGIF
jgi:hypothetical protein